MKSVADSSDQGNSDFADFPSNTKLRVQNKTMQSNRPISGLTSTSKFSVSRPLKTSQTVRKTMRFDAFN